MPYVPSEFARLFTRHRGMLSSYILSLVRDPNATEDVLQDVAVNLMEKFETFDGGNFGAWARKVAKWHVMNHWRSESRRRRLLKQATLELLDTEFERAEGRFLRWEALKNALVKCLKELGEATRRMLEMRYVEGLDLAAVAAKVGKKAGAVQMRVARARDSLAECVGRRTRAG